MRIISVLACMGMMILIASDAYCHSPQDISITINGENIDITVSHSVSDPFSHFIKAIQVSRNNTLLINQAFFQQTGDKQIARYCIPGLKKGDIVAVQADCSKFGSLVRTRQAE